MFEKDTPGQQEQRTIHGMSNILIDSNSNKLFRIFKFKIRIPYFCMSVTSVFPKEIYPLKNKQKRKRKKYPGNQLKGIKRLLKPKWNIHQGQNQHRLECKKSEKPMRPYLS